MSDRKKEKRRTERSKQMRGQDEKRKNEREKRRIPFKKKLQIQTIPLTKSLFRMKAVGKK